MPAPADAVGPIDPYAFNPGYYDLLRAKDGDRVLPAPKFFADLVPENGSDLICMAGVLEHVPSDARLGLFRAILDFEADVDRIFSLHAGPTKSVPGGPAPKRPRRGGQLDENGV